MNSQATILILAPAKNAADCLKSYVRGIHSLDYPPGLISLGMLESDSSDDSFALCQSALAGLDQRLVRSWQTVHG